MMILAKRFDKISNRKLKPKLKLLKMESFQNMATTKKQPEKKSKEILTFRAYTK
jgi:hypothetical protein